MEEGKKILKDSPELKAGFWSRIFYCWLDPLFKTGYKRTLQMDDVFHVLQQDSSKYLCDKLEVQWDREMAAYTANPQYKPNLRRALFRTFAVQYILWGIVIFFEEIIKIIQPLLLGGLIRYFTPGSEIKTWEAYLYAVGVGVCSMIPATTHHPYFLAMFRFGAWARIACCSLIYKKALKLSSSALSKATVGHIVNLMSNDVLRLDMSALFLHFIVLAPLEIIAVFIILWFKINWSAVAGMSLMLLMLPVQGVFGRIFAFLRTKTAGHTDERVRLINELLCAMKIVKMYCWESFFSKLISDVRKKEVSRIMRASYARAFAIAPFFSSSKLIAFFTFLTYVLTGNTLTAEVVFVTLSLYNPVRMSITFFLALGVQFTSEAMVTVHRLEDFLLLEEAHIKKPIIDAPVADPKVTLSNVTASWDQTGGSNILEDVSFQVGRGELLAVIGSVGAGKTSLLMTILGELPTLKGQVSVEGRVAYVSQQPWVFSASVRQNITFGLPFDSDKYNRVLHAAALNKDLALMPEGDQTLVGERGVSLSGGQKARVGLARALYSDADVYLLDDPLSAVDTQVGRHIFKKCICGLLKDKPRILVTHQVHFLPATDRILVLKGSEKMNIGTYEELSSRGLDFESLLKRNEEEEKLIDSSRSKSPHSLQSHLPHETGDHVANSSPVSSTRGSTKKLHSGLDAVSEQLSRSYTQLHRMLGTPKSDAEARKGLLKKSGDDDPKTGSTKGLANGLHNAASGSVVSLASTSSIALFTDEGEFIPQAQEEEVRAGGSVKPSLYVRYFYAGSGVIGLFLCLILNLLAQATYILVDWWLAYWCRVIELNSLPTNSSVPDNSSLLFPPSANTSFEAGSFNATSMSDQPANDKKPFDNMYYLYVFTGLSITVIVIGQLRALQSFHMLVQAAKAFHARMLQAILRCPMAFFDTNPIGRILNRFSKDLGQIEEAMPFFMYDFLQCSLLCIGVILVVGIINPWVFIPSVPICILFLVIRHFYLRTARSLKRLEATAKSPVFSHISSTVLGLPTIRAYQAEQTFTQEFDGHQDTHTAANYLFFVTSRWFAVRLEWLCALFITAVALCSVFAASTLQAGLVGLSLNYAMTMMAMFQWAVRQSSEVESYMTSVERIVEYSELPPEADIDETDHNKPPKDWPTTGRITAENVCLQYGDTGPVVLSGLNFSINDREKIGIVGRTGAGKSSLITAFFRLAEPTGKLVIDGVDIRTLGLHTVRKKLSIIPQDPILLNGTFRMNLDPLSQYSDLQIWHALDQVQLKAMVAELPNGLESEIHEGGSNISMGQRQLVCLARAILKCNRILIIDEATANVDPMTDALIQKTIREQFAHCTVLTIAHRLNTIVDSDRVMVLSEGHIMEFDTPTALLQNPNSHFHQMAKQTGDKEFNNLLDDAQNALRTKVEKLAKENGATSHVD